MKSETYDLWENAQGYLEEAEELWKNGKPNEAASIAEMAVIVACAAVARLSRELKDPYL